MSQKTLTPREAWEALNPRQQTYLHALYDLDQQAEELERSRWARGGRSRAADEWRWIFYGVVPETGRDSLLRQQLRAAKLVDPGTGSTFQALESRGLIWCRGTDMESVYLRMTPKGRKVVRAALGEAAPQKLPSGMLREWHWAALAKAYAAGSKGIPSDGTGYYAHIGWNTWRRLLDYTEEALIEETQPTYGANGMPNYALAITPFGKWYYAEHYNTYQARYPDVAARKPRTTHPKPAAAVEAPHPKRLHVRAVLIGDIINYHTQRPIREDQPELALAVALHQHMYHMGVATTADIDPHHEMLIADASTDELARWLVTAINATLDAAPSETALPPRPAGTLTPPYAGVYGGVGSFTWEALHWNRLGQKTAAERATAHAYWVNAMAHNAPLRYPPGQTARWCQVARMPSAEEADSLTQRLNALLGSLPSATTSHEGSDHDALSL